LEVIGGCHVILIEVELVLNAVTFSGALGARGKTFIYQLNHTRLA